MDQTLQRRLANLKDTTSLTMCDHLDMCTTSPNQVLRGKLWVTGLREAMDLYPRMTAVVSLGVDLTDEIRHLTAFEHKFVDVQDIPAEDLLQHFDSCTKFIHTNISRPGGRVLVHCQEGVSRSVTIVTAYLMRYHHLSLYQALACVLDARPLAGPNEGFIEQLVMYSGHLQTFS